MSYKVGIAISHGTKVVSFCMLDQKQAELLYSILDQDPPRRKEAVLSLLAVMKDAKSKGIKSEYLSVNRVVPGSSVLTHETIQIPWQAGQLLGVALALQNEMGLINLKKDLEKIIMGTAENRSVLKPYFAAEGFRV